jgi:hypothetical protein
MTNTAISAELDRIFTNIVSGQFDKAKFRLNELAK